MKNRTSLLKNTGTYNSGFHFNALTTTPSASDGSSSSQVTVSWTGSTTGADRYYLYRCDSNVTTRSSCNYLTYSTATSGDATISYSDTSVNADTTYYYRIWPYSTTIAGWGEASYSPSNAGYAMSKVAISAADGTSSSGVLVDWTAGPSFASSYNVYRCSSTSATTKDCTSIASLDTSDIKFNTKYTDQSGSPGVRYYYRVIACTSIGCNTIANTNYDAGFKRLAAPGSVSASDGGTTGNVNISWASVTNATSYSVYRCTSTSTSSCLELASSIGTTSYSDVSASPGANYFYRVKALNSLSTSDFSIYDSGFSQPVPTNVTATSDTYTDKILISWSKATGANGYLVKRCGKEKFSNICTDLQPVESATSLVDTGGVFYDRFLNKVSIPAPAPGVEYAYTVKACNALGCSAETVCTSKLPCNGSRRLLEPTGVVASDGESADAVNITWNKVSGANGYSIHRCSSTSTSSCGTAIGSTSSLSFSDFATPADNTYYYYRVKAKYTSTDIYNAQYTNYSDFSGYNSGFNAALPTFPAEYSFSASDFTYKDKVRIQWDPIPFASYYEVERLGSYKQYVYNPITKKYELKIIDGWYKLSTESVSTFTLVPIYDCSVFPCKLTGFKTGKVFVNNDTTAPELIKRTYRLKACNAAGCSIYGTTDDGTRQDGTGPIISVSNPVDDLINRDQLGQFEGMVSDATGVSSLKMRVQLGQGAAATYLQKDQNGFPIWSSNEFWIDLGVSGTSSAWSLNDVPYQLTNLLTDGVYTVTFKAEDSVSSANVSYSTKTLVGDSNSQFESNITINLNPTNMRLDPELGLEVTGELTFYGNIDVPTITNGGKQVGLSITKIGEISPVHESQVSTDLNGQYVFRDIMDFASASGEYEVKVSYAGSNGTTASDASANLTVSPMAGYALIIKGRQCIDGICEGENEHHKTAQRVYDTFKNGGFIDDNIFYYSFNYDSTSDPDAGGILPDAQGIDGLPDKTTIASAISNLATTISTNAQYEPAPFYVVMVNHGDTDVFHIDTDPISADTNVDEIYPSDVDGWFDTFETALPNISPVNGNIENERVFIYGACRSGSFIEDVVGPGRIIISSAAAEEVSFKGPTEDDGVRVGEYFLEELFKILEQGENLKSAFQLATEATELFTQSTTEEISVNGFFDTAVQHPLLEDDASNFDGSWGSNELSDGSGDGQLAKQVTLGFFADNPATNPSAISKVGALPRLVDSVSNASVLWATADENFVDSVSVNIAGPDQTTAIDTERTLQVDPVLVNVLLTAPSAGSFPVGVPAGSWWVNYDQFTTPGRYDLFFNSQKASELNNNFPEVSSTKQYVAYKQAPNNAAPTVNDSDTNGTWELLLPADGETVATAVFFDWEDAVDPVNANAGTYPQCSESKVTYSLYIADNIGFTSFTPYGASSSQSEPFVIHDISRSWIAVGGRQLKDEQQYFWKIHAVDECGAERISPTWDFNTNNPNSGIPGILQGIIYSDLDLSRLTANINVSFLSALNDNVIAALSNENGEFALIVDNFGGGNDFRLNTLANGFQAKQTDVFLEPAGTVNVNIGLSERPDADGDGLFDDGEDPHVGQGIGAADDLDHDQDGMTDVWELQYPSGLDPIVDDSLGDADSDGYSNLEEFEAGTDPTDENDIPRRSKAWKAIIPLILNE